MKRKTITMICLMLLMLCFCTADVFAMEDSKAVAGKKVFSLGAHTYISEIADGHAVVVAGDGTRFELKGEGIDGLYLWIIELLEGDDAYEWLGSELKSNGEMQEAYAVLLMNGAGEYVTADKDFTVTIQVKASGKGLKVWHVEPNGNKTALQPVKGDHLSVIGTKTDYYAVVRGDSSGEGAPGENVPGGNTSGSHVSGSNVSSGAFGVIKTGDNAGVFLWGLLVIVGAAGCVAGVKSKKRDIHMRNSGHK